MDYGNLLLLAAFAIATALGFAFRVIWVGAIPAAFPALYCLFLVVGDRKADIGWIVGYPLMIAAPYLMVGILGAWVGQGIRRRLRRPNVQREVD